MRYACLIYYDPRTLFGGSPEARAVLETCSTHDQVLKASGHFVAGEALQLPDRARTVTVRDGTISVVDGPFAETKEILGGFIVIEARTIEEAAEVAATHPIARIGFVEVRPLVDFSQPPPDFSQLA